jgi:two-component system chemotaxis response regulator CheY
VARPETFPGKTHYGYEFFSDGFDEWRFADYPARSRGGFVKTILAVDDSATVRQMTGLVLRGAGFEVLEAVDGVDALAKLTGQELSLILTDLNMPNMDGLELTRRVRKLANYKFVPVVLLTTESHPEKKLEGKAAGATAWLVKPFNPDQLLAVVKKVIT